MFSIVLRRRGGGGQSGRRWRGGDPSRRGQRPLFMGGRDETVETPSEPACQHVACGYAGLSQLRIRSCSRSPHG